MKNLLLLITLTMATTCGCSVPQVPQVQPEVAQQMPQQWGKPGLPGEVTSGWLASFNDPKLTAVVTEVVETNYDLQVGAATVERTAALATQAGAALTPFVGAVGGGQIKEGKGTTTKGGLGLSVNWELDVWGRVRAGTTAAEQAYIAAELDYAYARQSLAAAGAKAYFLVITAKRLKGFADETVQRDEQITELTRTARQIGAASEQDLQIVEADLARFRSAQEQAQRGYELAVRTLETMMGRYPTAELETAAGLPDLPGAVPAGVPSTLLERRPDLVAARRRVDATFYNVVAAQRARLPSFSLTGGFGRSTAQLGSMISVADTALTAGGSVFAPIFDGGLTRAQLQQATAEQKAAIAAYNTAILAAFRDVETALADEASLDEEIRHARGRVEARRKATAIEEVRFKTGGSTMFKLSTLQLEQIGAETAMINLDNARLAKRIDLHLALGGGFEDVPPAGQALGIATKAAEKWPDEHGSQQGQQRR